MSGAADGAAGRGADLERIGDALRRAATVLDRYAGYEVPYELKAGHGPVTAADHEVDALLRGLLPQPGDGWLSEETPDDLARLSCRRVWVVDPLDGTRSFVAGRPEYSVSIALVEDGVPVLGGVCNPAAAVTVTGGPGLGVRVIGDATQAWPPHPAPVVRALCSRTEYRQGHWRRWEQQGVVVHTISSVAYKLALVAAGAADATWTVWPKSEWDVAAGHALVAAAGGRCWLPGGGVPRYNRRQPRYAGFVAAAPGRQREVERLVAQGFDA